jgi:hypothetical protein
LSEVGPMQIAKRPKVSRQICWWISKAS